MIFYASVSLSWIFVFLVSQDASGVQPLQSIYGADFWVALCSQAQGFNNLFSLFLMWVIMSGAMMMPTLVPTLKTYQDLIYSGAGNSLGFILVSCGFLMVWIFFGLFMAVLQAFFLEQNFVNSTGQIIYPIFSTSLLASAGLYQFSKLKNRCATKCRAPLVFFMEFWRPGSIQSFKMGLRLGLSCLGCCWMLMLLAFVGGTMSFAFMGLATLIMVLEKLPQLGNYISKPLGYLLILGASLNLLI